MMMMKMMMAEELDYGNNDNDKNIRDNIRNLLIWSNETRIK